MEVVQGWQQIVRDDVVLLCSDGLSGLVPSEEMAREVGGVANLTHACNRLIDLANRRGGPDNITVVLVRLTGGGLPTLEEIKNSHEFA